jgi:hypothetical protein
LTLSDIVVASTTVNPSNTYVPNNDAPCSTIEWLLPLGEASGAAMTSAAAVMLQLAGTACVHWVVVAGELS